LNQISNKVLKDKRVKMGRDYIEDLKEALKKLRVLRRPQS